MKVYIGADYRGFERKSQLLKYFAGTDYEVIDVGAYSYDEGDDFNDPAIAVAKAVREEGGARGILICDSAHGVTMQANRFKGIRAAICHNPNECIETRGHNDANILCLASDQHTNDYAEIINAFIHSSPLPDQKYQRRKQKLDED